MLNQEPEGAAEQKSRQREQAFVKSQGAYYEKQKWQSTTRNRKDTAVWIGTTDNSLRQTIGIGLSHFVISEKMEDKVPASKWPLASYAGDEGTVEDSCKNVLQRKLRCNLDDMKDPGHAMWNTCKGSLKKSGLWDHTGLMMLAWNAPHGPWAEDRRYREAFFFVLCVVTPFCTFVILCIFNVSMLEVCIYTQFHYNFNL